MDLENKAVRFRMESIADINQLLVPLFRDHPLQSGKHKDYLYFSQSLDIINRK